MNELQILEATILLKEQNLKYLNESLVNRKIKDLNIRQVYKDIEYCDNIAKKYLQIPVINFNEELDKHEMKKLYRKFRIMKITRRLKNALFGMTVLGGLTIASQSSSVKAKEITSDTNITNKEDLIIGGTIGGIAGFFTGAFIGMIGDRSFIMKEKIETRDCFIRVNRDDNIYDVLLVYRKNGRKILLKSFELKSRHFF